MIFQRKFRGAVRPPFIEGVMFSSLCEGLLRFRGAVRPPFIEGCQRCGSVLGSQTVSGGSPPPLH